MNLTEIKNQTLNMTMKTPTKFNVLDLKVSSVSDLILKMFLILHAKISKISDSALNSFGTFIEILNKVTAVPRPSIDSEFFKKRTISIIVDSRLANCIDLIHYNLLSVFIRVIVAVVILSLFTGKIETNTKQKWKSFIRNLPLKLSVLYFYLQINRIIMRLIFKMPLSPLLTFQGITTIILIIFLFIFCKIVFEVKMEILLNFYSLCSYNLGIHILAVIGLLGRNLPSLLRFSEESLMHFLCFFISVSIGFFTIKATKLLFSFERREQ